MISRFLLSLLGIVVLATNGFAAPDNPVRDNPVKHNVVVELFTSQGCPNCPDANAFLADLAQQENVIALSFAVDYWDYLGWRDTFAMPAFTARQYAYGKALKYSRIYTPQIVLNGRKIYKGMHQSKIRKAIEQNASHTGPVDTDVPAVKARLNAKGQLVLDIAGKPSGKVAIWLAAYTPGTQSIEVRGGENKGKSLVQVNMVSGMTKLADWDGNPVHMVLPMPGEGGCAILLQAEALGPILAAAKVET